MATLSTSYASTTDTTAITITVASLATSSGTAVGRQSTVVDNSTFLYLDAILSGQITTGTNPTGGRIEVWAWGVLKRVTSTNTFPVATATVLGASDADATFSSEQKRQLAVVASIPVATTSDRAYTINPRSVAALFGGVLPLFWGVWVTHNTGVNLNSTAGNHWMHYHGVKAVSA